MVRLRHGAGRDVGGRAHAGLVGEEAALDAVEHGGSQPAGDAASRLLEAEGAHDDVAEHAGHLAEVHDHHDDGEQQVDAGHERHDDLGHLGDLANAAEDDDAGQRRDGESGHQRRQAERAFDGAGDRVGLHRVEDEAEGDDQRDRENDGGPGRAQAARDVEGRSAAVLTFLVLDLEELGQRAFGVGGGHADQGHHPHPEDRAGAAQIEGDGDAGEVAGADPGREADRQGLEGRDAGSIGLARAANNAEHFAEMDELDEAQAQGEEQAYGQQAVDQHVAPENGIEEVDDGDHGVPPAGSGLTSLVHVSMRAGDLGDFDASSTISARPMLNASRLCSAWRLADQLAFQGAAGLR